MSLRAERQGDDFKVMWNQDVPAITAATSGILNIEDGGVKCQIQLDDTQIGSAASYTRPHLEISFHLTTVTDGRSTGRL